jgi:hypothetical protein
MAAEINTDAELTTYAGTAGLGTLSASKITTANTRAVDMIRQAALNDYTAASFEDLTNLTAPPEMKQMHCYLALGVYSDGDAARPETITERWTEAKKYLGFLTAGRTHYDESEDAVLVKRGSARVVAPNSRSRIFDRDENCDFSSRDEWI